MNNQTQVFSVSDVNAMVRDTLEGTFMPFWITGETGNLVIHRSGHVYLTLKDASSQIKAVYFNGAEFCRSIGLREGMKIEGFGKLSVYAPRGEYQMKLKLLRVHGHQLKKLVRIGIPCGFNGIVFSISNVILQSTVNTFGDIVVAGVSAAGSVNNFVYVFLASFYTACVSFAGQNFGAKKYRRIDMLLARSMVACVSMIVAAATLVTAFSDFLLKLYTNDLAVVEAGRPIMEMICWSYALYAVPEVCTGCLRGMGESTAPTLLNVFCICGLRFIWIFLVFPLNPAVPMLYLCYPISYALCGAAQYIYYRRCRRRYQET